MADDVLINKAATIERCVGRAREEHDSRGGWTPPPLAEGLERMIGFRNIALHGYQSLQLPITVSIIERHLDEFLDCSRALLLRDAGLAAGSP